MINGIGVVGWGVGGIEAEAGMLGQPVYFLTPDVVGVELTGKLSEGITATDLVLTVTEMLRKEKVVGKFVEFFGEGTASLAVPDRATIGNMAPEYGATMGFFPVDDATIDYLTATGRTAAEIDAFASYFKAQGLFGIPRAGEIDYTKVGDARPRVDQAVARRPEAPAGPHRARQPQATFTSSSASRSPKTASRSRPTSSAAAIRRAGQGRRRRDQRRLAAAPGNGAAARRRRDGQQPADARSRAAPAPELVDIGNGDVLIAAITSCTNTSNPGVLLAAGLLAKKAVEKGLTVKPHIKTSLAPGSRVVTDYLTQGRPPALSRAARLRRHRLRLHDLHRQRRRPRRRRSTRRSRSNDLVCAAVLSGNRNFEARIHPNLKANFLASPPLVVAYAIAGTVLQDLTTEPLGIGKDGAGVPQGHLADVARDRRGDAVRASDPAIFRKLYGDLANANPLWGTIAGATGQVYDWPASTYIAKPPFFDGFKMTPASVGDIKRRARARHLRRLGDHRPHLARRLDQADLARGQLPAGERRRRSPTSTATARAAAITR